MTDLGKLLDDYEDGIDGAWNHNSNELLDTTRAAIESHVAELRERAEKAERRGARWKELARTVILRIRFASAMWNDERFRLTKQKDAEHFRAEKAEAKLARVQAVVADSWCTCDSAAQCLACLIGEALGEP